ncbi:protein HIGH CHLOROPHYLL FLUORESCENCE PHENOTYPE 244, chloroplastic isoform X2 [Beta vulgaris subsp. vulgaris]|uniref:protein HIGH CHLOROPHYLL FLUORESCENCE PHENOTYPE 244, chloroplastic isoform X2 n=1 Tax=Beta vulgaris subsp. vulgaris TaxID=3555 RepID=UPI00054030F8|nr:protein HIGH CHLOROPHYLL FLUORESCENCE PHENOTYPE 244, chloroplastic isoform X2 [Beta vulgaris subsp. vulgaris]
MAGRLPAQVSTPPKLRHHHCHTGCPTILSWKTNLILQNFRVSSPSSLSSLSGRSYVRPLIKCTAQPAAATNYAPGTPVRPTSILVVGSTGTLGRQIVRRALDEGYDVRCLVRPRPAPADFLRDWGATVVNADLSRPETIPATLVGVHTIIDCATGRPEEPIKTGLIGQYAVPILEEKSVWGTDAPTRIAYMDTQDIARLTFIALRNENLNGKLLTFAGPRAWTTQEVITLCERLAGQDANVTTVPVSILRSTRQLTRFFQWTNDVADRLAFSEVLSSDMVFSVPMTETYSLLGVDPKDIVGLEKYMQDYFTNILKKLKDLKAQSKQSDIFF